MGCLLHPPSAHSKIRDIELLRIGVRPGAKGRLVDVSHFRGRKNVHIRFSERVRLSLSEQELGGGVTITCRE